MNFFLAVEKTIFLLFFYFLTILISLTNAKIIFLHLKIISYPFQHTPIWHTASSYNNILKTLAITSSHRSPFPTTVDGIIEIVFLILNPHDP